MINLFLRDEFIQSKDDVTLEKSFYEDTKNKMLQSKKVGSIDPTNGINVVTPNSDPYNGYNGQFATAYANRWVKTSSDYRDASTTQTISNYNPAYKPQICADCANFVSQCLNYGGLSTDTSWQPYTSAWLRVSYLIPYLESKYASFINQSSAMPGDIAKLKEAGHVVIVTYNDGNTQKYNGHTSDVY